MKLSELAKQIEDYIAKKGDGEVKIVSYYGGFRDLEVDFYWTKDFTWMTI